MVGKSINNRGMCLHCHKAHCSNGCDCHVDTYCVYRRDLKPDVTKPRRVMMKNDGVEGVWGKGVIRKLANNASSGDVV